MTFVKGQPRPKNAGRKKGTPDKASKNVALAAESMNHNAAIEHIKLYREAIALFNEAKKKKGRWGAASHLENARNTNADLMKYIYPQLKAIEHTGAEGGPIQFKTYNEIIKALGGEVDESGKDENSDPSSET